MIPVTSPTDLHLAWAPPGFSRARWNQLQATTPGNPHLAAGDAWSEYAATLDTATSVRTGAQSVSYGPGGAAAAARKQAAWHYARARAYSVPVGPDRPPPAHAWETDATIWATDHDDRWDGPLVPSGARLWPYGLDSRERYADGTLRGYRDKGPHGRRAR